MTKNVHTLAFTREQFLSFTLSFPLEQNPHILCDEATVHMPEDDLLSKETTSMKWTFVNLSFIKKSWFFLFFTFRVQSKKHS